MNDYGEIIKLPYKIETIYEPLKKLLKYDKIKPMILQNEDEKNKSFDLIAKGKLIFNEKVNIKITEIEKEMTEIKVYSKSKFLVPFDFGKNKRNVRIMVNAILKELSNYRNTSDDFSIEFMKTYKFSKGFLHFIISSIIFYYLWSWFLALTHIISNMEAEAAITMVISFTLFTTIIYKILRIIKIKKYRTKRKTKMKSMLYDLIEGKAKESNNISRSQDIKNETKNNQYQKIKNKINPYLNKSIDYIKKTKKEKPKVFWAFTISICVIISWVILNPLFTPKTLEGEYIQQMGRISNKYSSAFAHSIKFSNGKAAMAGPGQFYETAPWYEYKIKGNKIYVIQSGKEIDTEFKIKNKNTLIYGDGKIDEYCPDPKILVCGPNFDGIYKKN